MWASRTMVPWADPAFRFQINLVVLLAEMFMCFEVLKPDFVQAKDLPDGHGEAQPGVQVGGGGHALTDPPLSAAAASPQATEASTPQNSSGSRYAFPIG